MTSVDLTGVTSGGQSVDPWGAWLAAPDTSMTLTDPGVGSFTSDAAGNVFDKTGTVVIPADQASSVLGTEMTDPGSLPPETFRMDAGGNVIDTRDSQVVVPAAEMANPGSLPVDSSEFPTDKLDEPGFASGLSKFLKSTGNFLTTSPWGRFLATLGIGAAGLGISQGIAGGGAGRLRIPQPPQTAGQRAISDLFATNPAATQALQDSVLGGLQGSAKGAGILGRQLDVASSALTAESPIQADIRGAALSNLLTEEQGGVPADPVQADLRAQLLGTSGSPAMAAVPAVPAGAALNPHDLALREQYTAATGIGAMAGDRNADPAAGGTPFTQAYLDWLAAKTAAVPAVPGRAAVPATPGLRARTDPVTAALQKDLLSISSTGTTNPALKRQFREQKDVLQNRMVTAEGPQWEMTTPGIDASTKLTESQAIQNYQDWLDTIKTLAGPYQTGQNQSYDQWLRTIGAYQAGTNQAATRSTALSAIGRPDVPTTVSALTGIVNPGDVAGIGTTNTQALNAQDAQTRAAFGSATAGQNARLGLGKSVADLFGRATQNAFRLAA